MRPVWAAVGACRASASVRRFCGWRDAFLAAGGEALESERLKARLGAMLLERELLEAKIALLESGRPLAHRRSRR